MTLELTAQQQQALEEQKEFPPRVVNPRTGQAYVLIEAEMYERLRTLLEEEDEIASVRETYPLVSGVLDAEDVGDSSKEIA